MSSSWNDSFATAFCLVRGKVIKLSGIGDQGRQAIKIMSLRQKRPSRSPHFALTFSLHTFLIFQRLFCTIMYHKIILTRSRKTLPLPVVVTYGSTCAMFKSKLKKLKRLAPKKNSYIYENGTFLLQKA